MTHATRMDMHAHSSASRAGAAPWLHALGIAECYSEPEAVYDLARARGMHLVTLTDHDTIDGALCLRERGFPGVVIGEEITTAFPEDGCRLHVLVWGLTPEQHDEVGEMDLRRDVYALGDWLHARNLAHALAHPLHAQNSRLTPAHLEKCALLFRAWEVLNGAHPAWHREELESFLDALTPPRVGELGRRHALGSFWARPWVKARTAGSDDHALLTLGRTWTEVAHDGVAPLEPEEFLRRVMSAQGTPMGRGGDAESLTRQLVSVGAGFAARRRLHGADPAERGAPHAASTRMQRAASRLGERVMALGSAGVDGSFIDALADVADASTKDDLPAVLDAVRDADPVGALDALSAWALTAGAQAPALAALLQQSRSRTLAAHLRAGAAGASSTDPSDQPFSLALFTDTFDEVNGVSRFIRDLLVHAGQPARTLAVMTCRDPVAHGTDAGVESFEPVLKLPVPGYAGLTVSVPPVLRMLARCVELAPRAVHVSTPGPVGLVGVLAAKLLRVPLVFTHHTDFPAYVDRLVEDPGAASACRWLLRVLLSASDRVLLRSESSSGQLRSLGVPSERMATLTPGVDTRRFHPSRRDPRLWAALARANSQPALGRPALKVLYVGRISREKNLELLAPAWRDAHHRLVRAGIAADLVIVGDGPERERLSGMLRGTPAYFLGVRTGEPLASVYASSDLLVFPSRTDTLGQSVLEAMASAVTPVVSDAGGPSLIVEHARTGWVVGSQDAREWGGVIAGLLEDHHRRESLARAAADAAGAMPIGASVEHFWSIHRDLVRSPAMPASIAAVPVSAWT